MLSCLSFMGLDAPLIALSDLNPAIAIPFVAILPPFVFVLSLVGIKLLHNYRTRKLQQGTIRLLIEKGQPIPPELLKFAEVRKVRDDRRSGLILIAVGIALYFFLGGSSFMGGINDDLRWSSLIPGLIGVALILNWALERRSKQHNDEK